MKQSASTGKRSVRVPSPRTKESGDTAAVSPLASSTTQASPVAVGMRGAPHPPHRSVRAVLPHTAPTSDASVKCLAYSAQPLGLLSRSVSGECKVSRRSPWSAVFPPPPPPRVAPLGSAASSVLHRSPTPPPPTRPQYGFWPSRTGLLYGQARGRSPGTRACCVSACLGSSITPGPAPG